MSKIAFFGTPDFAAILFEGLISYCQSNGHSIEFAVCQPDRPQGRSQKTLPPPVKTLALQHQIEVLQPQTLKAGTPDGEDFFARLKGASLDLAIVVAYGRLIPKRMLDLPRRGFINVHASLLPRWRGASPIQHALLAGDATTGVAIMDLVPEMDAGDVYLMRALSIAPQDTAGTLTTKLAHLGLETLLDSLEDILSGTLTKTPQSLDSVTFAPKLLKEDGSIPWTRSASDIVNHSRAMDPWPQSYTYLKNTLVKLFGAHLTERGASSDAIPGTILSANSELIVQSSTGPVAFTELQFEGKRRISIRDAVNGKLIHPGDQFSTHPKIA